MTRKQVVYDRVETGGDIVKCVRCEQLYDGTKIDFCPYCAFDREVMFAYYEQQERKLKQKEGRKR